MVETTITRVTKVDAVNRVLATIGVAPVASLDGTLSLTVELAQTAIDNVSRDLQSTTWGFNTEKDVEFTANESGAIRLTASTAVYISSFDFEEPTSFDPIIKYDGANASVYDRKTKSFLAFTPNATYKATVTYYLQWLDLPEAVKAYVMARAAREYQLQMVGNPQMDQMLVTQMLIAQQNLTEFEAAQFDYTIFDNYDVFRSIERSYGSIALVDRS
jgi:IS1 family transposase